MKIIDIYPKYYESAQRFSPKKLIKPLSFLFDGFVVPVEPLTDFLLVLILFNVKLHLCVKMIFTDFTDLWFMDCFLTGLKICKLQVCSCVIIVLCVCYQCAHAQHSSVCFCQLRAR